MASVIVYRDSDGVAIMFPSGRISALDAASSLPAGTAWREVDSSDLPQESEYRSAWTANFDDEPCVVSLNAEKQAVIDARLAAEHAVAEFDSWWIEQVEQGFRSQDGIRLGLETADVALLTGNYVLAKEAAALSLDLPPVIDKDGVPHALEIDDLTALMLEYGQYRAALSAEYASRKAALGG